MLVDADLGALLGCLGPLLMVGWWVWGEVSGAVREGLGCMYCIVLYCIMLYCGVLFLWEWVDGWVGIGIGVE